jgi:hypothetical protein
VPQEQRKKMSVLIKGITLEQFYRDLNNVRDMDVDWDVVQLSADVIERKKGEWVKNEGRVGWHCSSCGVDNNYAYSWNNGTGENEFQDNFCPHCGADMRETK